MERKFFLGQYLIWVILLLGQLHGYKSCVEKERKALLDLKKYIFSITIKEMSDYVVPNWSYEAKSDCCRWDGVKCNPASKRVTDIDFGDLYLKDTYLLNLSLLHSFEDVRSLSFHGGNEFLGVVYYRFNGVFDDVEGYKSLSRLRNLEILDLSSNEFNSSIFPFLNAATSLTTLSLRDNDFDGPFPAKEVKDLTNLELLNLSRNRFKGPLEVQGYKSLRRLNNLEILDLSRNTFNNSIFPVLGSATSLKRLFLRSNKLDCPFPEEELKDLTNLELLDLSENKFNGPLPMLVLPALRNLKALDLSGNEFFASMGLQGKSIHILCYFIKVGGELTFTDVYVNLHLIITGICEMKNMQELDLSHNKLEGQFPLCLTDLTRLRVLDLSSNQLTGKVPSSLGNLRSLKYLSLLDNNFEGFFSLGSLANLSELRVFKLGSKSKSFQVKSKSNWKPKFQLSVIELASCNLVKVPCFLLYQKDLSRIDLSNNKMSGYFPHWLLVNNSKLEVLFLQNNSFTSFQLQDSAHNLHFLDASANDFNHMLPENIGWILPHLHYMKLANNGFHGFLPSSLGNMEDILYLDLSHNSFHGTLPRSFLTGCYSMAFLTLSHNKLSGEAFSSETVNFPGIKELSMDNNLFTGKIGQGLRSMEFLELLDISNNNLTGVIPSWIGEFQNLQALLLSNNSLEGEIPISLFNLTDLELLDLSANILSGGIPPKVSSTRRVLLLLQDNNLSGAIPDTLLINVTILDLRNNRLSGNIPEFSNTQDTHTLLLRGNDLSGSIPHRLCGLRNIKLLDLADNRLNGSIPSCFSNTSFSFGKEDSVFDQDYGSIVAIDIKFTGFTPQRDFRVEGFRIYFESLIMVEPFILIYKTITRIKIEFATKHRYDTYLGENLKLLFGMDLSKNELSGDIPTDLGGLLEIQSLNLSHNSLSGLIPKSFSGLKNVESLDLSFNRLQGRIPSQLTELCNLAVFNVSFNNLSGVIPQGKQFNTFDAKSYLGNPLLCGQSINTSCDNSHYQEPENGIEDDESKIDMVSFYWSVAAAYVTILLGIFTSLSFDSPWRRFWFSIVDAFIHKAKNLLLFAGAESIPLPSSSSSYTELHGYKGCIQKERNALMELKQYLISISEEGQADYVLPTWTNDTKSHCCHWEGVKCSRTSPRVTKIAFGDLYLKENSFFNLSLLHPFDEVRSLDFSGCAFSALFDDMEGYKSLSRLRNLESLDLSSNQFNNSIFPFLNAATSLTTLFLGFNKMDGPFPVKELRNLSNLELLDLSGNGYNNSMPGRTYVCFLKNLQELYLRGNYLAGRLPLCLGSLNKLQVLDLSLNQLSGTIPSSFSSLESLEYLSLSDNNFRGLFSLSFLANLTKLKVLKLSSTSDKVQVVTESTWLPKFQLSIASLPSCGLKKIPNFLMYQKKLLLLDLSSNRIPGTIPTWLLANNSELEVLQLQNNSFTVFQIPTIVHKLQFLDFSANNINGVVLPDGFGHVLSNLIHMNGSHNGFQGKFPSSIGEMKNISFLDLSHNNLSGEIPRSLFTGCYSLQILHLSHNKFTGHVLPRQTNLTSLVVLRMDNNLFTGEIGEGFLTLVNLSVLDISNNLLSGSVPSLIPNSSDMFMLLLSNNLLEGTLPSSLLANQHLNFLDLSGNLLSGALPSYDSSIYGIKLFLHNNSFTGEIPRTLLENAEILDLRNNKLSGSIPQFVNTMDMRIFLLKGNNLTGAIPRELCGLKNIGVLDISNNKLSGVIPSCLHNLSFGSGEYEEVRNGATEAYGFVPSLHWELYRSSFLVDEFKLDYETYMSFEIQFAAKQRYDSYTEESKISRGTLDFMYGLDLSSNVLSGVIPEELGELSKLRAMNLSRNFLSSSIPDSFSKLKDIESLDLSYNMLHGNIPRQLTNLTSLAVFNVSYNNLSGIIPQGRQFDTFNDMSYLSNPLLCGLPTKRSCQEAKKRTEEVDKRGEEEVDKRGEEEDDEADIDMMVFYWTSASTYVTASIGILVLMFFDCLWRQAWLRLVDAFITSTKKVCVS
ncbi:unnamed protein product [Eruca vesicaria subsp. sativa]|uniref:Leucine-rich repeat-containing N-terminal plant-type domain-containing protein n=1 Tax=Eruca vesicaria subsp. sativa TaxID=29727 RepID=A0ABC8IUC7_ERUVS|nr:unnamed protein product [Eruca vesicaria subsp. sativa]